MKQLLFLLLFPCLAMAQYQGNGNQKITLGEQTTADGLVYRGVENDTALITPFSDTSAYIILDTINNKFYNYNRSTNVWSLAGGGGGGGGSGTVTSITAGTGLTGGTITTSGTLAADTNFLVTRFDTSSMLLPYWRSGRFSGVLPVANGGTGSATQNFVDLTTTQSSIGGAKTFTSETHVNNNLRVDSKTLFVDATLNRVAIGHDTTNSSFYKLDIRDTEPLNFSALYTGTSTTGTAALAIQTQANNSFLNGRFIIVGQNAVSNTGTKFGDSRSGMALIEAYDPSVLMIGTNNASSIKFATNNTVKTQITSAGEVWIGYTTDQGTSLLQVNGSVLANGSVLTSDKRFKENIIPLSKGLDIVNKLNPVTFNYINDTDNNFSEFEEVGFIAQDVDKVLSTETFAKSIVKYTDESNIDSKMVISPQNLIPILTKAIQEQQALIKALEQRILILENK